MTTDFSNDFLKIIRNLDPIKLTVTICLVSECDENL